MLQEVLSFAGACGSSSCTEAAVRLSEAEVWIGAAAAESPPDWRCLSDCSYRVLFLCPAGVCRQSVAGARLAPRPPMLHLVFKPAHRAALGTTYAHVYGFRESFPLAQWRPCCE